MKANTIETVMTQEYWENNFKHNCKRKYKNQLRKRFIRKCKGIAIVLFMLFTLGCAGTSDFYTETGFIERKGTFLEVEGKQYIHTDDGHVWEVIDTDFSNGDKVRVIFDTHWSENVKDYEIIEIENCWF